MNENEKLVAGILGCAAFGLVTRAISRVCPECGKPAKFLDDICPSCGTALKLINVASSIRALLR